MKTPLVPQNITSFLYTANCLLIGAGFPLWTLVKWRVSPVTTIFFLFALFAAGLRAFAMAEVCFVGWKALEDYGDPLGNWLTVTLDEPNASGSRPRRSRSKRPPSPPAYASDETPGGSQSRPSSPSPTWTATATTERRSPSPFPDSEGLTPSANSNRNNRNENARSGNAIVERDDLSHTEDEDEDADIPTMHLRSHAVNGNPLTEDHRLNSRLTSPHFFLARTSDNEEEIAGSEFAEVVNVSPRGKMPDPVNFPHPPIVVYSAGGTRTRLMATETVE